MRSHPERYHRIEEHPEAEYLRGILDELAESRARVIISHADAWTEAGRIGWTTGDHTAIMVHNARSRGGTILDAYDITGIRSSRKDGPRYYLGPDPKGSVRL